jgi:hypothetical protein
VLSASGGLLFKADQVLADCGKVSPSSFRGRPKAGARNPFPQPDRGPWIPDSRFRGFRNDDREGFSAAN